MRLEPTEARHRHAAQCDHRQLRLAGQPQQSRPSQAPRAGVRAGGEHRRYEHRVSPHPLGLPQFEQVVDGERDKAAPATIMHPGFAASQLVRAGADQHQPARPRDLRHLGEQCAPLGKAQAIVAEDHAATARKPVQRRPERITHPLVRHQPGCRQGSGVTTRHDRAYSAAMPDNATTPAERLHDVNQHIARAAATAGRAADGVTLIAVSKTHEAPAIQPLINAGHRVFGENRVQEAAGKWPRLRETTAGLSLHLVGQLQSNKAADAVALFDAIHSVDRPSLVAALARAMERANRRPACFIQVNIGEEPQKGGCAIADLPALLIDARAADLPVAGLMAVPPFDTEPAPYFALLAKLARDEGLEGLSMGMSGDYSTAVTLGATHVRVGTALFGNR